MKNFKKLFLFFLSCIFITILYSEKVLGKEIKYEIRGSIISLEQFDLKSNVLDIEGFKRYIMDNFNIIKDNEFNTVFIDLSKFIDLHITENFNEKHKEMLKFLVSESRKRCLEIHASFCDFSLKDVENNNLKAYITNLSKDSFIKDNIDWIIRFNDNFYLDPGVHEVRDYFIDKISSIANEFFFDGVYLHSMIYPENINKYTFNDFKSFDIYNEDKLPRDEFRRQNVNDFVKILGEKFKSYKSELKFGIGVNYIWRNIKDDLNGIDFYGYSDYDHGCFDTLNIAKSGYINYIIPKIKENIKSDKDINEILDWWNKKLRSYTVDIFIEGYNNIEKIIKNIRGNDNINGFLVNQLDELKESKLWSEFAGEFLSHKALTPRFKSYDSYYTFLDIEVKPKVLNKELEFIITDSGFENTKCFIVYKFPYDDLDCENGEFIQEIFPSQGEITNIKVNRDEGVYAITKLNYNSIESKIKSVIIYSNKHGLIEESLNYDRTKVVDDEVEFFINDNNHNNEFKLLVERNGEYVTETEFNDDSKFTWICDKPGIYKVNVIIRSKENINDKVESYLSFEVKNDYVVFLDPGHGGIEYGAKSNDGVLEKDINLNISRYLSEIIDNKEKISYITSRVNDITMDLSHRVSLCAFLGGDLFVSIHQNAFDNDKVHGIETYYYTKENKSKEICELVQNSLIERTSAFDRGIKNSNFVVLRENTVPSILIECGFITNEKEKEKISNSDYQREIAESILESIYNYLEIQEV